MSGSLGTREYFLGEVRAMFEAMGTTDFWDLPSEDREGAMKGLLTAYLRAGNLTRGDEAIMEAAMYHYSRTELYTSTR